MSHDPMCFMSEGKWDGGCQCSLIARVREDERGKFIKVDTTYMTAEQYDAMIQAIGGYVWEYEDNLEKNNES